MKKNGRRYRRLQKEKELKTRNDKTELNKKICQEVGEMNTAFLAMSHIIIKNPILNDNDIAGKEYFRRLKSYVRAGRWERRKYVSSQLCAYEKIIAGSEKGLEERNMDSYKYYILFDLMHVLGYEMEKNFSERISDVMVKYYEDFPEMEQKKEFLKLLFRSFGADSRNLRQLADNPEFAQEKEYIQMIGENLKFRKKPPFGIAITATMSAGKSTFINALAGKRVCLSQNMACTSKIHCIVNKAFEDGYFYEYDHDLVLTAGDEELFHNNEENALDKIVVSTYFNGGLRNARIIVDDSPGVNFSGDMSHREVTERFLKARNYNLLIYVMDATQLATNDEDEHLDFVRHTIGRTPVIFVINKVDAYNVEEENVMEMIRRQTEYLKKKGFKNPMICPVSSRAGYLSKRFKEGLSLSRSEKQELYNYMDKFTQMNLQKYYKENFQDIKVLDAEDEESQLMKTCGFAYVEKLIEKLTGGEK